MTDFSAMASFRLIPLPLLPTQNFDACSDSKNSWALAFRSENGRARENLPLSHAEIVPIAVRKRNDARVTPDLVAHRPTRRLL